MARYRADEVKSGDVSLFRVARQGRAFTKRRRRVEFADKGQIVPIIASRDGALEDCIAALVNNTY
jgi:hypothetical protein